MKTIKEYETVTELLGAQDIVEAMRYTTGGMASIGPSIGKVFNFEYGEGNLNSWFGQKFEWSDGTVVLMLSNYCSSKKIILKLKKCEHTYTSTKTGNCRYVYTCSKCGETHEIDSSD